VFETFSDLSGRYSFSGLVRGTYQVIAEGDGQTFESTSVSVQLSQFGSSGQLFTQDIQLRAIRGKALVARGGVVNAFTQDVPKSAREKFERAQKLAGEGKSELVMAQLQEAVRIFPQYFEAHLMMGNQLIQAGRLDEAIPPLDRAREINAKDERVYQSFGLLMMKQRKYPIAVAIFEEAARLNPNNPLNPLMRASALIYQASYVDAERVGQRADLLNQADLSLSKASELSDKKIKPDPLTLAMFYDLKGQPSRAAEELEEYLKKNPATKNSEAIKNEIARLRSKTTN
jgi:tetratricopeptide (TPR) repeat protein